MKSETQTIGAHVKIMAYGFSGKHTYIYMTPVGYGQLWASTVFVIWYRVSLGSGVAAGQYGSISTKEPGKTNPPQWGYSQSDFDFHPCGVEGARR